MSSGIKIGLEEFVVPIHKTPMAMASFTKEVYPQLAKHPLEAFS